MTARLRKPPLVLRDRSGEGQPLVTVITRCFNQGRYLTEALETLLAQDYPAVEPLVVDDGSDERFTRDAIWEIERDSRVRVLRHERNLGAAQALNTGIAEAGGRYILPFDADNRLLPTALGDLVAQLNAAERRVGFIYPQMQFFGNRNDSYRPPAYNLFTLLQGNYCDTCSLIDADVFEQGLRFPTGVYREDWHFWLELAKRGVRGELARAKTFLFRRQGFNRSDLVTHGKGSGELDRAAREMHPEFFRDQKAYAAVKSDWLPAVSVVPLTPTRTEAEHSDLWNALESQTAVDAEAVLLGEWPFASNGPCIRPLPVRDPADAAAVLTSGLREARGRLIVVTDGTGVELFADPAFLEKLLRLFCGPAHALSLVEQATGEWPWKLVQPSPDRLPHAVAWSVDRLGDHRQAIDLPAGRAAAGIAEAIAARAPVELRAVPPPPSAATLPRITSLHLSARGPESGGLGRRDAELAGAALLPTLPEEQRPQPRAQPWLPPQSRRIYRHVNARTGLRAVTESGDPPPGCRLERCLGTVKVQRLPGTLRLDVDGGLVAPDVRYRARDDEEAEDASRALGFIEAAPLPMLAKLGVGLLPRTGQHVLVSGLDDPLIPELLEVRYLGWIEPSPLAPAAPATNAAPTVDVFQAELAPLLRAVDAKARRHRYGVGELSQGTLVGELGGFLAEADVGTVAAFLSPGGVVYTEDYRPHRRRPGLRAALRWTLSPLRWGAYGGRAQRFWTSLKRGAQSLRYMLIPAKLQIPAAPDEPPVGYLHGSGGTGRAPLFAASHPVVGDQLLSVWADEAVKLGYDTPVLLGYLAVATDERGIPLAPYLHAVPIPWAWKFGRAGQAVRDLSIGGAYAATDPAPAPPAPVSGRPPATVARQRPVGRAGEPAPEPKPEPSPAEPEARRPLSASVRYDLLGELRVLFDGAYYSEQVDETFESHDDALAHYLEGDPISADPHPLFDTAWYLRQNPDVTGGDESPLVHFLAHGADDLLDPNPYFDTEFYYSQRPRLREERRNALAHYVSTTDTTPAYPNPLFRNPFYLRTYGDVRHEAGTPLEHFLRFGAADGRHGNHIHRELMLQLRGALSSLWRGEWRTGTVLFFLRGGAGHDIEPTLALADRLGGEHHLGTLVLVCRGTGSRLALDGGSLPFALDEFGSSREIGADILRPSALRLLARSLGALSPLFAVVDVPESVQPLEEGGAPTYFLMSDSERLPEVVALEGVFEHARRAVLPSSSSFHAIRESLGHPPTNVALATAPNSGLGSPPRKATNGQPNVPGVDGTELLLDLAESDLGLSLRLAGEVRADHGRRQRSRSILIPCSDWSVSGVNASLEAVGQELIELGWDVQIVFTRDEATVLETSHGEAHLPTLPHGFLQRDKPGVLGMWEALIAYVERRAPCILFTGYDFLGNSVVPALTDRVGVVMWAQADDGDYYEQVYRLGLYANAVVCVSRRIRDGVSALNPVIGERAHVIHNSSIWSRDIVATRAEEPREAMQLIYSGRLVQYQKRVLDFIDLARALDATGAPYELSLVGTFSSRENTEAAFRADAREHLSDGRIKLVGRRTRSEILDELARQDFFVLLSDFEGLPLALVEAMACGCVPVVAESPSGIPELIESGRDGLIMEGRDYRHWAEVLVATWEDRRRHLQLSQAAREKVRGEFTVEHIGEQFHRLFSGIADEIESGSYRRPPSLTWGRDRSQSGDVLPPPNIHRPAALQLPGLQ